MRRTRPAIAARMLVVVWAVAAPVAMPVAVNAQDRAPADVQNFCSNIVDEARERRYAIQREELETLRADIEAKIAVLEERRAAYQQWAEKREEFAEAANEGLVAVYANMRPDAAAVRMEELPAELSAALLTKLKPRASAAILNEMSTKDAALITQIMAAVGDVGLPEGDG
ncbi:MAG: MotE family protein [Phyllobacteriaceae bacterium]|nr:MotE family protein [Phyllobacteriaceae bacterium]